MYYARDLFVKKGPLGTIWLAGNLLKRVSKATILASNLRLLCATVATPTVPLALPTQSTLLRGVVRIENRKASYLLDDALEARIKLRVAERDVARTTLPTGKQQATTAAITLTTVDPTDLRSAQQLDPSRLDELDLFADLSQDRTAIDLSAQSRLYAERESLYTARMEEITLSEIGMRESEISMFEVEMGELEAQIEMTHEDVKELEAIDVPIEMPPSPATTIRSALVPTEELLEAVAPEVILPAAVPPARRRRVPRRRRPIKIVIDRVTELTDNEIRKSLAEVSDILITRPLLPPTDEALVARDEYLKLPAQADIHSEERLNVSLELLSLYNEVCSMKVLIEEGVVPAELERERGVGAEVEWEAEFPYEASVAADLESVAEGRISRISLRTAEEEIERERAAISETESFITARSFLGTELPESFLLEEKQASQEERARRRREPRISFEFEVPAIERPTPEIVIPEESERLRLEEQAALTERHVITRLTHMFRTELQRKLDRLEAEGEVPEIEFDEFLQSILKTTLISRRDRGISFFQLLVLRTLDIIYTEQTTPFGDILCRKGSRYTAEFTQIR